MACARDMLAMLEADSYDYLFTAEAKSIPPDPRDGPSKRCEKISSP